jgi:Zn-finger protein
MLYPWNYVNKIINRIIWVTQKNIEDEENKVLKKEELKEKIRKNKTNSSVNG